MTKGEAWRKWWTETHGKNMPMGGYHPMEGHIHDAFTAGWEAHASNMPAVPSQTGNAQSPDIEGGGVPLEMRNLL